MGRNWEDARQSNTVIATQLGISTSTVSRRIQKLIKQEAIRIIASPDSVKVGTPLRAILALDVNGKDLQAVAKDLAKRPEIRWVSVTTGRFDLFAAVWVSSTAELHDSLEEVSVIEGLKNIETFISLYQVKR